MADLIYTSVLERFTGEQFDEVFEFDGFIPESTTVSSAQVFVIDSTGIDVTVDRKVAEVVSGTTVTVTLTTGAVETAYIVKVIATSSSAVPSVQSKLLNVTAPGVYR